MNFIVQFLSYKYLFLKRVWLIACLGGVTTAHSMTIGCGLLHAMGEYDKALKKCTSDANKGDVNAAEILGTMYKNGQGVRQDNDEGEKWTRLANQLRNRIEKSRANATTAEDHWRICESSHLQGIYDFENTLVSCLHAANAGHLKAQLELAQRYTMGWGVPQDQNEVTKWYRKAAEQGDQVAQYAVAEILENHERYESERWYRKAADQGYGLAQYKLAKLISRNNSPNEESIKWYRKVAEVGEAKLQQNYVYVSDGIFFDYRNAIVDSQFQLGQIYENGMGVPQDYIEGIRWYQKAAEHGHQNAQIALGQMHEHGSGTATDFVQAHMWFNLAASQGYQIGTKAAEARDRIAKKMNTFQVSIAQAKAKEWFRRKGR